MARNWSIAHVLLAVAALIFAFVLALPASAAAAAPTNVRMQNVMKQLVTTSGQEVIGLGSWISGAKYKDVLAGGTSDHDLRLLSKGSSPAEVQREWMRARSTLTDLVKKEFGPDADKVLKSINLYPPTQIMKGVEDASDALARFKKLGKMPNLGYTGSVAEAPAAMAEGLYGPGAKVWTQSYEKSAGRLFYARDGKVFMGMTDLTHFSEGLARYDVPGMCNTTGQWADHLAEELHESRGDKVAKYLERLDRDLAKAKNLSRLDLDPRWRGRIKEIVATLQKDPSKLAALQDEVAEIVKRSRDEAAILNRMAKAGSMEKKLLAEVMKDMRSKGRLSKILGAAGEVATVDRAITAVMVIVHVQQTAKFAGEGEMHQAISTALAGVVGMASFPAGLLMDITNWTIEAAKSGGYDFAASTQEAWDLMAGVYSAVGRADVDAGPGYTLDQLVARIEDENRLQAVVYAKAMLASGRDAGEATGKADQKVGEAIFNRCFPVILAAWRARREELAGEYGEILDEVAHTPILMSYSPAPAELKPKERIRVAVTARVEDKAFDRKIGRAREILQILTRRGVFADFTWKWSGGKGMADPAAREFEFANGGVFPVSAALRVSVGSTNDAAKLTRRFDLQSGIDIDVKGVAVPAAAKKPAALQPAPLLLQAKRPDWTLSYNDLDPWMIAGINAGERHRSGGDIGFFEAILVKKIIISPPIPIFGIDNIKDPNIYLRGQVNITAHHWSPSRAATWAKHPLFQEPSDYTRATGQGDLPLPGLGIEKTPWRRWMTEGYPHWKYGAENWGWRGLVGGNVALQVRFSYWVTSPSHPFEYPDDLRIVQGRLAAVAPWKEAVKKEIMDYVSSLRLNRDAIGTLIDLAPLP